MASFSDHCPLCSAGDRDAAGELKHQPWCAHFLRGPDAGGDPHEWQTLDYELANSKGRPEQRHPDEAPKRRRTYNDHRLIAARRELRELEARGGRISEREELAAEIERRELAAAIADEED